MENINAIVSENLKRLREQRRLSLDELSKRSGVSKSMLGQIERREANPTISTVWKIADGLKVPFSELLDRAQAECEVIRIAEISPLSEDGGRYRNYTVFPCDADRRFEMLYVELDPASRLKAEPHPSGTSEFITVFSGEMTVITIGKTLTARRGDSIRFRADTSHEYHNTGSEVCRASMVIYYG